MSNKIGRNSPIGVLGIQIVSCIYKYDKPRPAILRLTYHTVRRRLVPVPGCVWRFIYAVRFGMSFKPVRPVTSKASLDQLLDVP
jgi:hypothetical protein